MNAKSGRRLALVDGDLRFARPDGDGRREAGGRYYPLGLLSLEAWLRSASPWEVEVLGWEPLVCAEGEEIAAMASWLDTLEAPVLGFSVTSLSLPPVLQALRRRSRRDQRVILGGPGAQGLPPGFLLDFPEVDAVIPGEGEVPLAAALRFFAGEAEAIPGAWYRRDGAVVAPREPARLPSLDGIPSVSYPPAGRSPVRIMTESSRGCPFRCIFCNSPGAWGSRVTTKPVERIVSELRDLAERMGPLQVVFVDDLFTLSRQRVLALCRRLEQAALPIQWACFGRIGTVDEEILDAMAGAGCQAVSFGIESGSDRVLRHLGKTFTAEQVRQVLARVRSLIPMIETSFIRGFPFETLGEFGATLELMERCRELECHVKLYTLTPLPGTQLHRELEPSWRWSPGFRNPSLQTWAGPEHPGLADLFEEHPYLACPFGYYDYPDREAKEAMDPDWAGRLHAVALGTRTTA